MKKTVILFFGFMIIACQPAPQNQLIVYLENEDGVDPYKTRIIVTPGFIRFDEGDASTTFLLFDRANKMAHSVNHEMKSTMIVRGKVHDVKPPMMLNHTIKIIDDLQDAPKIEGTTPIHRQHSTNGEICFDVISVEGLMPAAVAAMKEFHQVLASDSASTFNIIPADMLNPCDISMSTFVPIRHLQHGFPVQEWKEGYARSLLEYKKDYKVDAALLAIPDNYFTYTVQEFREGRVDMMKQKVLTDADIAAMEKESSTQAEGLKNPTVGNDAVVEKPETNGTELEATVKEK